MKKNNPPHIFTSSFIEGENAAFYIQHIISCH
ncbi:hypothetical protein EPIR_3316 [Erwinia piriflorinigrans CFBP 5888]|uniref:Uncharacterized protein n=1 Tax=Erwinia piriflorinigrans CFBP 5888 TaxID=1161919 RepID=V5ZCK0_9GAMM|nr:hypothetical protein EPIR_3316 [Erwinia piriflorinigrans CFBP 5888]